jgi:hypothetical protein
VTEPVGESTSPKQRKRPLYWRVLGLKHVQPSSWQRAIFVEGALAVAVVLVLADLATAWLILALPIVVALVVKGQDVLVGWLREAPGPTHAYEAEIAPVALAPTFEPVAVMNEPVEVWSEPEPESSVRIVPAPRTVRSRPGAAAARAQVSTAGVRRRRTQTDPGDGESAT